jgi:hypothetical protein
MDLLVGLLAGERYTTAWIEVLQLAPVRSDE